MLNNAEEKLEETNEITRRLETIRNSKEVQAFIANIKYEAENSGIEVRFKSRIKENESAIRKYKKNRQQNESLELRDLCGMMVVVDNIGEVYEFVDLLSGKFGMAQSKMRDYIKKPKAGYRSIHVNTTFLADGIIVPAEIQIKTEAMSIAQDTTHDSIYKLASMDEKIRKRLCTALFPIFEKNADAGRAEKRDDLETAARLRAEATEIRDENAQLFLEHQEVVNNSWKEFGKALFKHHNLEQIQGGLLLANPSLTKEDKIKLDKQLDTALEKLFGYYCERSDRTLECPSVSGDGNIDYAIQRLNIMEHHELEAELKHVLEVELMKKRENVKVASIEDFAKIDQTVSAENRRMMLPELLREISLLDRENTKDKEESDRSVDR